MKKNDITVLLLLFNTSRHLLKNLSSYKKFNVVILDQSNDNKIKKDVLKILPNIKYYKITHINKGFAYGINFLTNKVKTKFFLCTQADVKISYKDILKLKLPFVKNKDAVISVPHIRSFNNFSSRQKKNKKIFKVDKIIGAIFLAEKKKFHLIKKFDENFFFYWEDIDLSKRVEMSKYSLYLNYKSKALHLGGKSSDQSLKNSFIKHSNFKFGEYLYQYKYKKLKQIKVIREMVKFPFLIIFYLATFQFTSFFKICFYLYGIYKFYKFLLFS